MYDTIGRSPNRLIVSDGEDMAVVALARSDPAIRIVLHAEARNVVPFGAGVDSPLTP